MTSRIARNVLVGIGAAALVACGGASSDDGDGGTAGNPDLAEVAQSLLDPPPAGQGIQLRMETTLDPGLETERCRFFTVPAGGLYVNRQMVRFSAGSHHVLLYATPYKAIPTRDVHGKEQDTTGVVDCGANGATGDWEVSGVVAGSQTASGPSLITDLPEGVALRIEEGAVLLMNTHYLNASAAKLETDARINLWTIAKDQVKQEAGVIFHYTGVIRVPAMSQGSARMVCPVTSDVTLLSAQSHMHKRGTGQVTQLVDWVTGAKIEDLYTSTHWENVEVKEWKAGKALRAGQGIDIECAYDNKEDRTVLQGLTTRDEMCMFIGVYYPRDAKLELCSPDGSFDNLSDSALYVGSGKTGCIDSLKCVVGAKGTDKLFECVTNSCEKVARPLRTAYQCQAAEVEGCKPGCAMAMDPADCVQDCVISKCGAELGACLAATCD